LLLVDEIKLHLRHCVEPQREWGVIFEDAMSGIEQNLLSLCLAVHDLERFVSNFKRALVIGDGGHNS